MPRGTRFGKLVVVRRSGTVPDHGHIYLCRCDCGTRTRVRGYHLRASATRSCGCLQREMTSAKCGNHYQPGRKFSRLTVVSEAGVTKKRNQSYLCQCRCGKSLTVQGRHLASGETQSCGCWYRDTRKTANLRHGKCPALHTTPEYSAYIREKGWCRNPNDRHYAYYGGRFIAFNFLSFAEFYAEVGDRPSPDCWLMRKDRDGHFEEGNLEWVPRKRKTHKIKSRK
jgi:hypothetical protein